MRRLRERRDVGFCSKADRARFSSCESQMLLGNARVHGVVEELTARSHAILIPRRTSAVRLWAGTTVARPRSLTGGLEQ